MAIRRRGFRRSFAVTVVAGTTGMLSACGGQSGATDSSAAGANSSGAGGSSAHAGTASSAAGNAVGGNAVGRAGSSAGDVGGNAASVGGSTSAGAGAGGQSMAGAGGVSINNDPRCPKSTVQAFPISAQQECSDAGLVCKLPIPCNSGTQVLTMTCKDKFWDVGAVGCTHPYDFCQEQPPNANGQLGPSIVCVDGEWDVERHLQGLADGPGGCPNKLPTGLCYRGGTGGGPRVHCGYPCENDPNKWTIVTCPDNTGEGSGGASSFVWSSDGACAAPG